MNKKIKILLFMILTVILINLLSLFVSADWVVCGSNNCRYDQDRAYCAGGTVSYWCPNGGECVDTNEICDGDCYGQDVNCYSAGTGTTTCAEDPSLCTGGDVCCGNTCKACCSNSDCGSSGSSPGSPYCSGNSIVRDIDTWNPTCNSGTCNDNNGWYTQTIKTCGANQECIGATCVNSCVPDCSGATCGGDGCGGSCGSCGGGQACSGGSCCVLKTWYRDADGDTYGNPGLTASACTQPGGYVSNNQDCNDNNASIKPGATEVCNGVDDNCVNGIADEAGLTTMTGCSQFGVCNGAYKTCVAGAYGACSILPVMEACNGLDDDCNGVVDNGATTTYYKDLDGDTFTNLSWSVDACTAPLGFKVSTSNDCNDNNNSINPSISENCNDMIDNNCDNNCDYDSAFCSKGDQVCGVGISAINVVELGVCPRNSIQINCESTVSRAGGQYDVNSIRATLGGRECSFNGWVGKNATFTCSIVGALPQSAVCSVNLSRSYQSGSNKTVSVINLTSEAGLCSDGLDNDCDGLTDGDIGGDPDCAVLTYRLCASYTQEEFFRIHKITSVDGMSKHLTPEVNGNRYYACPWNGIGVDSANCLGNQCVYNGTCYPNGTIGDLDNDFVKEICEVHSPGTWYDLTETACTNGLDDDNDTLIDLADDDCYGSVYGIVYDAVTDGVINGATITYSPPGLSGLFSQTVGSHADGSYNLVNVLVGTYNVVAKKNGYVDGVVKVTVNPAVTSSVNFSLIQGINCNADCSDNKGLCNAACNGFVDSSGNSCNFVNPSCNGKLKGSVFRYNTSGTQYEATCCEGPVANYGLVNDIRPSCPEGLSQVVQSTPVLLNGIRVIQKTVICRRTK